MCPSLPNSGVPEIFHVAKLHVRMHYEPDNHHADINSVNKFLTALLIMLVIIGTKSIFIIM